MKRKLRIILLKLRRFNLTELVSKDLLLKFISLVLAVVLWYFVGGEDRVNKNVMIPIEIINLPRNLVISNQFKKEIEVTVSGPRSIIQEMSSRAITRQVDLSAATPGTMVIENDNDHIPVPRGITVQRVQPSSIILSLDKLIQKRFPVSARTVGRVAEGYYVKKLKMDPDVISITGPLTTLSQVDELFTKPINLEGKKESVQLQVPLDLEPAIVELIGETSVTADLTIGLITVKQTIKDVEVHAIIDGLKRDVKPATVQVTANIPQKYIDLQRDPKSLIVATAGEPDSDGFLSVQVMPRADVHLPIEILAIVPDAVHLLNGLSNQKSVTQGKSELSQKPVEKKQQLLPAEKTPSAAVIEGGENGKKNESSPHKLIKPTKNKRKLTE